MINVNNNYAICDACQPIKIRYLDVEREGRKVNREWGER